MPINPKTGQPRRGSDFLIPSPKSENFTGVIGIKTGKHHDSGMVAYLCKAVTSVEIISRIGENSSLDASSISVAFIDAYLEALQQFKVGNVLSVTYAHDGTFILSKIAEHTKLHSGSRLP